MNRRFALAGAAIAVTAGVVMGASAPASAHDQLLSSNPAEGQALRAAPDSIVLQFSEDVLDIGGVVVVADSAGTNWADGAVTLDGGSVTQRVRAGAPNGTYQIRWRVVSSDGHPISDVIDYTVGDEPASPTVHEPAPTAAAPTPTPVANAGASDPLPTIALWGVGGALAGIAVFAGIRLLLTRRGTP